MVMRSDWSPFMDLRGCLASLSLSTVVVAPALAADEADYWSIRTIPEPEGVVLEVGGLLPLGDGEVMACTRRGEVWVIENAFDPEATIAVLAGSTADAESANDPHSSFVGGLLCFAPPAAAAIAVLPAPPA